MNAMTSKYFVSLLLICLFGLAGSAQTSYSESNEYKPRPIETPTPKKDPKRKTDDKDKTAMVPFSNATGDITVTIPLRVVGRSGSSVAGLKQEEVSVFVDGAEVPIVSFEQDKDPVTVILVLDSSPSAQLRFKTMKEQASKLVGDLPANMKVMVVDFNEKLNVRSLETTNRKDTLKGISSVEMGDGTSLYSAMHLMYGKILPQVPGRKVIVMMTDGVDTTSRSSDFSKSLAEVEKEDITIYPIHFDTRNDPIAPRNASGNRIYGIPGLIYIPPPGGLDAEYKRGLLYLNDLAAASGGRVFSAEKDRRGIEIASRRISQSLLRDHNRAEKKYRKPSGAREDQTAIARSDRTREFC
jgi:VWFA-related protein